MSEDSAPDRETSATDRETYKKWKQSVPLLYDWFTKHHLDWPSLSCRWGPIIEEHTFKRRQYLYLSERTDGTEPNKLTVVAAEVCKPRVAAAEPIMGFHAKYKNPNIKPHLTILHPGEVLEAESAKLTASWKKLHEVSHAKLEARGQVNKIREVPERPQVLITHTDAPELYVWDTERQENRAGVKGAGMHRLSHANLVLTGHADSAEFALDCASVDAGVASGGKDTQVLLWRLGDYEGGGLLKPRDAWAAPDGKSPPTLAARQALKGHTDTVEDVTFKPGSAAELASVGDDHALLLWDARSGAAPIAAVPSAHGEHDLHCVAWNAGQEHLLATGAADGTLRVWDRRRLGASAPPPLHLFTLHVGPIMRLEWAPYGPGVLASGSEDGLVCVWDLERGQSSNGGAASPPEAAPGPEPRRAALPPELIFQHLGHRSGVVTDFQWAADDPFTMVSVSDNRGGGTLQMWRLNDLIYLPEADALAALEAHRDFILSGKEDAGSFKPGAAANGAIKPPAGEVPAAEGPPAAPTPHVLVPVAAPQPAAPEPTAVTGEASHGPAVGAPPPASAPAPVAELAASIAAPDAADAEAAALLEAEEAEPMDAD